MISIFTERALAGSPITVFGDGEQTRDFLYVGDLVQVLAEALEMPAVEVGAVNVGLRQSTSLNQLLAAIGEVVGGLPEIRHAPGRAGTSATPWPTTSACWHASTSPSRRPWPRAWPNCSAAEPAP